jgi:cytochrome c
MKRSEQKIRFGRFALCVAVSGLALAGCSKESTDAGASDAAASAADVAAAPAEAPAPAAAPAAAAPAADNTETMTGVVLASYTGDAAKGKVVYLACQTCHSIEAGVNKIGPSLHAIIGKHSGVIPGYTYTAANKNAGINWTEEKLFQYLEKPQRVVPGTKMTYAGLADPQKRADVIAYLKTNS